MAQRLNNAVLQGFLRRYQSGEFPGKRLGQAAYSELLQDPAPGDQELDRLYELDGEAAVKQLHRIFDVFY